MTKAFAAWYGHSTALHCSRFTLTLLICSTLQHYVYDYSVGASPTGVSSGHNPQPSPTSGVSSETHRGWYRPIAGGQHVPCEDYKLEPITLPTTVLSDVPVDSEMREKYYINNWVGLFPHHLRGEASLPTVIDTLMSTLEGTSTSRQDMITGWTASYTTSNTYSLPHRYQTLKQVDGQWPPPQVKDTTYTPFINHNTNFPGHTFTVDGTISVATCAYGGRTHLLLEPNHILSSNLKSNHATQSPNPIDIASDSTQKHYSYPNSALHQVPMHADWVNLGPNAYWQDEHGDWRNALEEEVTVDRQYTLPMPFVLVPRPIERPLSGDWREYCYSTIVERYAEAAFLSLEDGALEDDNGYCWDFIDNDNDQDQNLNLCLHRFLPTWGCPGQVDGSLGAQWSAFSGDWLECNGRLEFWVCPSVEEREWIGVADAGKFLKL